MRSRLAILTQWKGILTLAFLLVIGGAVLLNTLPPAQMESSSWEKTLETMVPSKEITPTGVLASDYLDLAETVFANLVSDHFDCGLGSWVSKPYPQDPDLPSLFADGSEMFLAAATYITATGQMALGDCDLLPMMWNTFLYIENTMPDDHYQTGISCAKLVWGLDMLGGPVNTNSFWVSLSDVQRIQFQEWVLKNRDWQPVANNMYLFRAVIQYHVYEWGWDDSLADSIADQERFLDYVTDEGWLYDGSPGINDYCIYSVFGAFLNERLNAARMSSGDLPVRPEQSRAYTEAMLRYYLYAAGEDREPMPWSRSNGLYGFGVWLGMPEQVVAQGQSEGIDPGMYKRLAHLYYLWLERFWYDGHYFNPYLDPTGTERYENSYNGNGQIIAALLEAYMMAADTEDVAEVAIPAERMAYNLVYRFGDPGDSTYGVRVVNDPAGVLRDSRIEKPAYSSDWEPPEVEITAPLDGAIVASPVRVTWVGKGAQFYEVLVDGERNALTTAQQVNLRLSPGPHFIQLQGIDGAWNISCNGVLLQVADVDSEQYLPLLLRGNER